MSGAPAVDPTLLKKVGGFARWRTPSAYVLQPESIEDIQEALVWARKQGRRVALRGAGRTYGDGATLSEELVLDLTRFNRILDYNPDSGVIEAEGGATISDLCIHLLPFGRWPVVVPGTSRPTMGGAIGMGIHGKNQSKVGSFANHVEELELLLADGSIHTLTPNDDLFRWLVGSAGLLGIVTRVKVATMPVGGGDVLVSNTATGDWQSSFAAFEASADADYLVHTVDMFASGGHAGRGLFQRGDLVKGGEPRAAEMPTGEDMSEIAAKLFNRKTMRALNWWEGRRVKPSREVHLENFSFQLDAMPGWEKAWGANGFFQLQSFVPAEAAPATFERQRAKFAEAGMQSWLSVMKRHRDDGFPLSPSRDGYSLALDIIPREGGVTLALLRDLADDVISARGRFYLAKDQFLTPEQFRRSVGDEAIGTLRALKSKLDPEGLFATDLGRRLELI